jgi:hypothetical protein
VGFQGQRFDRGAGYIIPATATPRRCAGSIGYDRKHGSVHRPFALVMKTEESLSAFATYTQGRTLAGRFYPAVSYDPVLGVSQLDKDGDGLIEGYESVLGTNTNSVDTDGDGQSDLAEYPVSGLQPIGADPRL